MRGVENILKHIKLVVLIYVICIGFGVCNVQAQDFYISEDPIRIIMCLNQLESNYLYCDVKPINEQGYTFIPGRAFAEYLKYSVMWDADKNAVTIFNQEFSLELTVGDTKVIANDQISYLPVAPYIFNDRIMIPIRYVAEFFDFKVLWADGTDKVQYIWISKSDFLDNSDVEISDDYCAIEWDNNIPILYKLSETGNTARGVHIGDSYSKVIDLYGQPHLINNKEGIAELWYTTPLFPSTGAGSQLVFYIKDDVIIYVKLFPSR